jgi:hypothetical protein
MKPLIIFCSGALTAGIALWAFCWVVEYLR